MSTSDGVYGKLYDEVVVAFDYLLHSMIKVELLTSDQFDMLMQRISVDSGLHPEAMQLTETYLRAMRSGEYDQV